MVNVPSDHSRDFFSNPTINPLDPSNILVYRRLIENIPNGIFIANQHHRIIYANHALAALLGLQSSQNLLGKDIYSELIPNDVPRNEFLQRIQMTSQNSSSEIKYTRFDGHAVIVSLSAHSVRDERNAIAGTEGVLIDITEGKRLADALFQEKQKLELLLNINERVNAIHDSDELINFIVDETAAMFNAKRCSLMLLDEEKKELTIRGSRGIDQEFIELTRIKLGDAFSGVVAKEGKPLLVKNIEYDAPHCRAKRPSYSSRSFMIVPIKFEGRIIGTINVADKTANDLTEGLFDEIDLKILCAIAREVAVALENAKLIKDLNLMTMTDPLTHIFNYRQFAQSLDFQIKRIEKEKRGTLCLIMLDVDQFKSYNDTFGHLEGDALLSNLGQILKAQLRESDVVCRYAGDEFVIVLPDTTEIGAQKAAMKVKSTVAEYPFKCKVTVSLGVARFQEGITSKELIRRADTALYFSKHGGRDQVCVYSEDMGNKSEK